MDGSKFIWEDWILQSGRIIWKDSGANSLKSCFELKFDIEISCAKYLGLCFWLAPSNFALLISLLAKIHPNSSNNRGYVCMHVCVIFFPIKLKVLNNYRILTMMRSLSLKEGKVDSIKIFYKQTSKLFSSFKGQHEQNIGGLPAFTRHKILKMYRIIPWCYYQQLLEAIMQNIYQILFSHPNFSVLHQYRSFVPLSSSTMQHTRLLYAREETHGS